jgi:hypothetical protein
VKFKRCCGSSRAAAQALELRLSAEDEARDLAALLPELRPESAAFEAWTESLGRVPDPVADETIEAGVAALDDAERARVLRAVDGRPWRELVDDLGDEERANHLLLRGAVAAALRERRPPVAVAFALLGRVPQAREDPVALLALLLNPFDVWSGEQLAKLGELDEATFVKKGVDALWDENCRRRLLRQVERLADHVPLGRGADLDAKVSEACAVLRSDEDARRELAALLAARAGVFLAAAA